MEWNTSGCINEYAHTFCTAEKQLKLFSSLRLLLFELPCNVMLFLSSEIDRSLLLICNALASNLAPMSPIKFPLISAKKKSKTKSAPTKFNWMLDERRLFYPFPSIRLGCLSVDEIACSSNQITVLLMRQISGRCSIRCVGEATYHDRG